MENIEREKRFVILGKASNGGGGGGEGTVTSVGISVPTGLTVIGSPVTSSGTIQIGFANGYSIPTTAKQDEWDAKSDFSGSYNDLTDKPTIPTVGNGTITITQGGVNKGTFTTNQSGNSTIALDAGGSGDVTAAGNNIFTGNNTFTGTTNRISTSLKVGGTGPYDTIIRPTGIKMSNSASYMSLGPDSLSLCIDGGGGLNVNVYDESNDEEEVYSAEMSVTQGELRVITGKGMKVDGNYVVTSNQLATVATSGSYNDLTNKPTIPAAQVNSDWNASSGVAQILNKPSMSTETLTFIDDNNVSTTVVVYTQPTV